MTPILDNPATLRAVIYLLALGYLVTVVMAVLFRADARYWRLTAARWRTVANVRRRQAVAFRRPAMPAKPEMRAVEKSLDHAIATTQSMEKSVGALQVSVNGIDVMVRRMLDVGMPTKARTIGPDLVPVAFTRPGGYEVPKDAHR